MNPNIKLKPDYELNFVSLVGAAPNDLKGRKTMPSRRLDDPNFKYLPACKTDIRETWNRARQSAI